MENLLNTTITLQGKAVELKKINKAGDRAQIKPEAGKLFWITLADYNIEGSVFTTKKKVQQSNASDSIDMARMAGFQNMKEYITHLILENQDLGPTALAKLYNLPNPIYVSKIMKHGDFSLVGSPRPEITKAWKAAKKLAAAEPKTEVKTEAPKSAVKSKPSKINQGVADRLADIDPANLPTELTNAILK